MKNKTILIGTLITLMTLTACNNPTTSESDNSSTAPSTSESTSQSPITPDLTFDTITSLLSYLGTTGKQTDIILGKSYQRENVIFETVMYGTKTTTINEKGYSYEGNTFYANGTENVKYIDSEFPSENYEEDDTFQVLRTLKDNVFYQIVDYESGKERDQALRNDYSSSLETQIAEATSINSVYYLTYYYDLVIKDRIIPGFDDINPTINTDGSTNYVINVSWSDSSSGYTYNYGAKLDIDLNKEGNLTSFTFDYIEQLDDSGSLITISSITDTFDITLGDKDAYTEEKLNPLDYFLTDYDVQLLWNDGILEENHIADLNNFPIGQLVRAEAINITPEKAVDTKLEIVNSSNPEVIKITTYANYEPTIKAVGEGKTTLTIRSESGIEKNVEVTVVAPEIESIKVNLYSSYKYKGESENVYVFMNPDNAKETYTVTASENIQLTKDSNGDYSVTYLETGDAWVKVTCDSKPEIFDQVNFVIEEMKSAEEIKNNMIGKWTGALPTMDGSSMIENAATVEFTTEDAGEGKKKGYFTLNSDDTGFTFITGQKYEFSYYIDETYTRKDRLLVLISTITYVSEANIEYSYDNNYAFFEFNGKDANIVISMKDPNYYGYTIDLDCKKVIESQE